MILPFVSLRAHLAVVEQLREAHKLIERMATRQAQQMADAITTFEGTSQRHAQELATIRGEADAHAVRLLENARAEADRADKRYADLMASYRQLKLVGAVEVAPVARVEPKPVDKVEAAIKVASRGDERLAAAIRRKVAEDRLQDVNEDEIVQRIQRGQRPAEEWAS